MQPMARYLCVLGLQGTADIVILLLTFSGRILAARRFIQFGELVTVGEMLVTNTARKQPTFEDKYEHRHGKR